MLTFIAVKNASLSSISKDNGVDWAIDWCSAALLDVISVCSGVLPIDCRDTAGLLAITILSPKPSSGVFLFEFLGFMLSEQEETVDSSTRVKTTREFFNFSPKMMFLPVFFRSCREKKNK